MLTKWRWQFKVIFNNWFLVYSYFLSVLNFFCIVLHNFSTPVFLNKTIAHLYLQVVYQMKMLVEKMEKFGASKRKAESHSKDFNKAKISIHYPGIEILHQAGILSQLQKYRNMNWERDGKQKEEWDGSIIIIKCQLLLINDVLLCSMVVLTGFIFSTKA